MLNVTLKNIKIVMNTQAVLTPAEKFQNRLLKQFGAYVRTIARRSIKPANRKRQISEPGQPPLFHRGRLTYKDTIFFVADAKRKEVVIGGVLLSDTNAETAVPGVLEHGGIAIFRQKSGKSKAFRRTTRVKPRPHMQPAFDKAVEKFLPELIRGGIMREV